MGSHKKLKVFDNLFLVMLSKLEKYFKYIVIIIAIQWFLLVCLKYYSFNYHTWDVGSAGNSLSNLVQTGHWYNTLLGRHALANHFTPNLLIFYPLFWLKNSVLWLLLAKVTAFLVCPFLLVKTGRLLKLPKYLLYIAPLLFLVHTYTANALLFEFQASSLSLPFILLSFNYAVEKKYWASFAFLLLLLGFKEHLALIWISVGAYVFLFQENRKVGSLFVVLGMLFGVLTFFVAMPYFAAGAESLHSVRFNPFALYAEKGMMIVWSLLSVGFMPLLAPRSLLFILPAFGISLISSDPNMMTFEYHYHDIAMVVLFFGVVLGLSNVDVVGDYLGKKTSSALVAGAVFIMVMMNHGFPAQKIRDYLPSTETAAMMREIEQIKQVVSKDTALWVTERFSIFFIDYTNLKSIDIWEGVDNVQKYSRRKTVVMPKSQEFSSLGQEKYDYLIRRLEADNRTGVASKHDGLQHFIIYDYNK
jgi:uncharacterized membrane protein